MQPSTPRARRRISAGGSNARNARTPAVSPDRRGRPVRARPVARRGARPRRPPRIPPQALLEGPVHRRLPAHAPARRQLPIHPGPALCLPDRALLQLVCAFRLCFPQVGIVLSTREPVRLRDTLAPWASPTCPPMSAPNPAATPVPAPTTSTSPSRANGSNSRRTPPAVRHRTVPHLRPPLRRRNGRHAPRQPTRPGVEGLGRGDPRRHLMERQLKQSGDKHRKIK